MSKIMTFCNGVTNPNRAFELNKGDVRLLAPSRRGDDGRVLGLYAFRCVECDAEHIRTAGKKTIEALVLFGVVPCCADPDEIPEPHNPLASNMLGLSSVGLNDIIPTLEAEMGTDSDLVIYL